MVLPIVCFAIEAVITYITFLVRILGGSLTTGYYWTMLCIFYICLFVSAYCVKKSISQSYTGEKLSKNMPFVFSILALGLGAIFLTIIRFRLFL